MAAPTTLEDYQKEIAAFCDERDWDQFHAPKDLAIGVVTEAGELAELFRFLTDEDQRQLMADPTFRARVGHELADVLFFLARFAQLYDFDLIGEAYAKLVADGERYPVETTKGLNRRPQDL